MIDGWIRGLALAFAALTLVACDMVKADPEADAAARLAYDQLAEGDYAALEAKLAPTLREPGIRDKLEQARKFVPAGEPKSGRTLQWQMNVVTGAPRTYFLRHVYDYGGKRTIVSTTLQRDSADKEWLLAGLYVLQPDAAAVRANAFTLAGKPPIQLAFLAATALSPLLMLIAFFVVLSRKRLKWKPLWCILAFLGLFSFNMNWTTGAITATWLAVRLIGAGVTTTPSGVDPWILTVTIPLGAVLILAKVWARPRPRDDRGSPPQLDG